MGIVYTKSEHLQDVSIAFGDGIALFYTNPVLNRSGKTRDTGEFYSETTAEWLLKEENLKRLKEQIPMITRSENNRSYNMAHKGTTSAPDSNRKEERLAMAMHKKSLPIVGKILEYQIPLQNVGKDKAGKIDLLSYDGQTVRLLELKEKGNKETMLRCVLECYTYFKTVDQAKLLEDFKNEGIAPGAPIKACPFVYYNGSQHIEMQEGRPQLQKLMAELDIKPLYYSLDANEIVSDVME